MGITTSHCQLGWEGGTSKTRGWLPAWMSSRSKLESAATSRRERRDAVNQQGILLSSPCASNATEGPFPP